MKTDLMSKLYLIGTYEAVAEAAMFVRRSPEPYGLTSSGIRAIGATAPGLYLFEGDCGGMTAGARAFCYALSNKFSTIVAGFSTLGRGFNDLRDDQCIWGASAYIDGVEILSDLKVSLPKSLPTDIATQIDSSNPDGALPKKLIPRLHELALDRIVEKSLSRKVRLTSEQRRLPWSPLTLAMQSHGADGIADGQIKEGVTLTSKAMIQESNILHSECTASWVDTLFFGSWGSTNSKGPLPFSDSDVKAWPKRHLALLRFLGNENGSSVGSVAHTLLGALSSPKIGFQTGQNPMTFLVTVKVPEDDAQASLGLRRLIDNVGMRTEDGDFDESHRHQCVDAIIKSEFKGDSLRLGMRMGMSPGYLVSRLLPLSSAPANEKVWVASQLIAGFREFYGSIKAFPEELNRAFEDGSESVSHAFASLQTKEIMSNVIASKASAAPVSARRRSCVI